MMSGSRSRARLLCGGLLLFVPALALAGPAGDGTSPSPPGNLSPDPGGREFPDADTLTVLSLTTTIGPDCELVLTDNGQERRYGPGESVHLEIRRGFATVNGLRVYQPPSAPEPDLPLASLVRTLSTVPFVREYVATHRGDSLRVWNDADVAYCAALGSLNRGARTLYHTLVRDGLPTAQIAERLRRLYLSSPLVADATAQVYPEGPKFIAVDVRERGAMSSYAVNFSDQPAPPRETPLHILTTDRAVKLRDVIESLSGRNGPAAWMIGYRGASHLHR
jgi:hypothetical protein